MEDRKWYIDQMSDKILEYLSDDYSFDWTEWVHESRNRLRTYLEGSSSLRDDATGETDGTYYGNSKEAREAVTEHGFSILSDMVSDGLIDYSTVGYWVCNSDWERADMEIRVYLYYAALDNVMDEIYEHLDELEAQCPEEEEDEGI